LYIAPARRESGESAAVARIELDDDRLDALRPGVVLVVGEEEQADGGVAPGGGGGLLDAGDEVELGLEPAVRVGELADELVLVAGFDGERLAAQLERSGRYSP
jgi:hypothetical protein